MPPSSLAALAGLLALALWWLGRRPPARLLRSTDASAVAALNRSQLHQPTALQPPGHPVSPAGQPSRSGPPSADEAAAAFAAASPLARQPAGVALRARDQQQLLKALQRHFEADHANRLVAVKVARRWGHRCTLPLLHRARRDPDPRVVLEAALALERFRGRQSRPQAGEPVVALPRNVSRTR
ncbi:HEAT repeat domain-containing protein [Cyanobium sp. LEGE 06113]|uniref:HEAT repeat domain-containing protein n=1 Tax=Cyanobium sp. LEGE 06113 TaxID=1297573 RepID=UPI00187E3487|nr:HEAT repeat domain-containing protein [Cyanobium sp. LEGE 06113]MBE9153298.1 HEAT repeat domain-containing protein [Cyanobium sp. LEGE 06113]